MHPTDPSPPANVDIAPERSADAPAILALHEAAFGPGRFARAAERVREMGARHTDPEENGTGEGHDRGLSFTAMRAGALIGSVRMTPIAIGGVRGYLLGPLAVRPADKHRGHGGALIARAHRAAGQRGSRYTLLVGDRPYYARHGFAAVHGPIMPGPVDPQRLLVRWNGEPTTLAGLVRHAGWE